MMTNLIETTPHENVKSKLLELIQAWAFAFRTYDKYQAIKVCFHALDLFIYLDFTHQRLS